jgi:hypothetical protein
MGQTSDPETLVIHQKKMTPGNNPEDFKQQQNILLKNINRLLRRVCYFVLS